MARTISELEFQAMEAHDFMWGIASGVDDHTAELSPDPQGPPLAMHHGTPSDSTTFAEWHEACRERDLHLICMSRPGYATSARLASGPQRGARCS